MKIVQFCIVLIEVGLAISFSIPTPQQPTERQSYRSRRVLLENAFSFAFLTTSGAATSSGILFPLPVQAASTVPTAQELERLQLGHARVRYMLDHWDEVTRVCGTSVMSDTERKQVIRTEGGGGTDACNKTPLRVQEFMGYKSIKDPLFNAYKLMVRASSLVDPDKFEEYLDTVERYREKADNTSMLAYTSSWGEANPNGSKELIDEFLEQTKVQAIESEKLLRAVLDYLNLQPLPPLQGKL